MTVLHEVDERVAIRLHLGERYGERWTRTPTSGVRGFAFRQGRLLEGPSLLAWVAAPETREHWAESLRGANGSFQVVYQDGTRVWAAVDRLRSRPLFYGTSGGSFYLSNDAYWVRDKVGDPDMDELAVAEFHSPGYVTVRDTLYPGVKQLQAGEALEVSNDANGPHVTLVRYYRYTHRDLLDDDPVTFAERSTEMYDGVARRLIESVAGRPIVIPLSGGYDSRSVAIMLKAHGYERVICYSYGQENSRNAEAAVSREVAERLGYPWLFVPYSNSMRLQLFESDERRAFDRYADNLTSLPLDQDWPAVRQLHRDGKIPADAVFAPGHSGDFLAGTHIVKHREWLRGGRLEDMVSAIRHEHYPYFERATPRGDSLWPRAAEKIGSTAGDTLDGSVEAALDACEAWDWQERQAKYVVNSVRVYEFFGYDWRIPLWDSEMLDLWERVPLIREGTALYDAQVARMGAPFGLRPNLPAGRARGAVVKDLARALRLEGVARRVKNRGDYHHDQMAHFGIIPPARAGEFASMFAPFKFYHAQVRLDEIRNGL